ncbi:hypothetical protein P154DRAFT_621811 [Amniculicola lignicola CBS 123094]|uniref:Uncharacterized protein n=1 Tax=Amniculicola lignicola CBS 123094 TaxID=1392246 RepID=A0A6A5W904_9PLEO|nr:hypothetical protein P154DRAFT_621811 [Amniculicola lignicola CBS 123094]
MGRKNADPLVGIPQGGHRNYSAGQSTKIDLKSLKFHKRARLDHYSLYTKGFQFDTIVELAEWDAALRPGTSLDGLKDPPDELWRTLVADCGMHDRNPPYWSLRARKETIMKGSLRSNTVDTTALIHNERNLVIAEFCRKVQAAIWNRALIKTKKGLLGLVSDQV